MINNGGQVMNSDCENEISIYFFTTEENIVVNVSKEFLKLTGYSNDQLTGKSIIEICKLLKINHRLLNANQ